MDSQKLEPLDNKIAICWPSDKGTEKIKSFNEIISKNGKILWGVNWNVPRITSGDFPIKGYVYYKQEIIAIATITNVTEHTKTDKSELQLRPTGLGYPENYTSYLHIKEFEICDPFPHTQLEMWDSEKQMPQVVQQRVCVKELNNFGKITELVISDIKLINQTI